MNIVLQITMLVALFAAVFESGCWYQAKKSLNETKRLLKVLEDLEKLLEGKYEKNDT